MKYIVISKDEWDALFAGKTQTLLRMPYERPDEYKAGDKLLVRGVYQKETASVTVKRVAGFDEGSGFRLEVSDFQRHPFVAYGGL